MPGLFDFLTGEGMALNIIKSLVESTKTATEILQEVADAGIKIRKSLGLDVIKYYREEIIPGANYLKNLRFDVHPNILKIPKSVTEQLRNFSYLLRYPNMGEDAADNPYRFVSVSTNTLLTKDQALDAGYGYASGEKYGSLETPEQMEVVSVTQNSAGLVDPNL